MLEYVGDPTGWNILFTLVFTFIQTSVCPVKLCGSFTQNIQRVAVPQSSYTANIFLHRAMLNDLLSARVILRLSSLLLHGLFGRSKVERASVLLAVKKTSVEYNVTTGNHRPDNLPLVAVNFFVNPAYAGFSHCWRVPPYAVLWASDRTIGAGQMFPTRLVTKPPPSGPTLLPARHSLVRPFTPLAPRLATKTNRDNCSTRLFYDTLSTAQVIKRRNVG
jgi:hypothetical protein